ncbi:hypothetical protein ACN47E_001477 [Coniothyrium glycines]
MELLLRLCSLFVYTVSARSLPLYASVSQQQPLVSGKTLLQEAPYVKTVILAVTNRQSQSEQYFRLPVQTRIPLDVIQGLPIHPSTIRIAAATDQYGQAAPVGRVDKIICRGEPGLSVEEEAAIEYGMKTKTWPWFGVTDGAVQLDSEESRWFLGGRAIKYYECR